MDYRDPFPVIPQFDRDPFSVRARLKQEWDFNSYLQEGDPFFPVEEIENGYEETLSPEALDAILSKTEGSVPFTEEDLDQFIQMAAIYNVNPSAAEEYYNELMRHFNNRVKTDPSREGARSCLEGPIQNVIKEKGFDEIINDMGAVVRFLEQDALYIRIKDIVVILGKYTGQGRNVGTAYVLKDGASASLTKANSPIAVQQANERLIDYMNGCGTVPVPSYSPKTNTDPSNADINPIPIVLALAILASLVSSRLRRGVAGQA